MADPILTGGTELAALVPQIWSPRFYDVLRATLPFIGSVDESYQGDIKNLGDTVKVLQVPDFAVADLLPQGSKGDATTVTATSQSLVINSRPYVDFIVEDIAQLQSVEFFDKLRDSAIYAIMRRIQNLIVGVISPVGGNALNYTTGTTLALADLLAVGRKLDALNVPRQGRVMVVGTSQLNDLFNIQQFTSRDYRSGSNEPSTSPMVTGQFSDTILGWTLKYSSLYGTGSAGSATTYFFHPLFATIAFQKQLNAETARGTWDGVRATRFNMDILMGVKQLDSSRVATLS